MSISYTKMLQQLLPVKQAAEYIGVTPMTLWRWEHEGKIGVYRIGREVLIEKAELERIREERNR